MHALQRTILRALTLSAILALGAASSVAANGGGGGEADLGLDAISIHATTVDPRTGIATVSGSISCSQDLQASVSVGLRQTVGRFNVIDGWNWTEVECLASDGSADFSLEIIGYGKFAGGAALVAARADTGFCTEEECFFDSVEVGPEWVRLRPH